MKRFPAVLLGLALAMTGCSSWTKSAGGPKPADVTQVNFTSVVNDNDKLVLVDCWAPWCGPCRTLAPTIDELAADYEGRVTVVKLNIDDNPGLAARYDVKAIPAVLLFKDGAIVSRRVGAQPKGNFVQDIEKALAN